MSEHPALAPADLKHAAELVKVLDSLTRLEILLLLDSGDRVVHELVAELRKSQPLISQHLRVLRKAGLVSAHRTGREVTYSLAQSGVIDIIHRLAKLEESQSAEQRDDLEQRRSARAGSETSAESSAESSVAGAAIVDPPAAWRPETDPGLAPRTPRPQRD